MSGQRSRPSDDLPRRRGSGSPDETPLRPENQPDDPDAHRAVAGVQRTLLAAAGDLRALEDRLRRARADLPSTSEAASDAMERGARPFTLHFVLAGALDCALEEHLPRLHDGLLDAARETQERLDREWRDRLRDEGGGPSS